MHWRLICNCCTYLQDGHNEAWEENYVATIVHNEVAWRGIDTVGACAECVRREDEELNRQVQVLTAFLHAWAADYYVRRTWRNRPQKPRGLL